jgi:hypothetical protein
MISGCLVLAAALTVGQLNDEFYRDFRSEPAEGAGLRLAGVDAADFTRSDQGLRVSLPGNRKDKGPVGVATTMVIEGDFELTAAFEILDAPEPPSGFGAGVSLWVQFATPKYEAASVSYLRAPKKGTRFVGDKEFIDEDGTQKHNTNTLSAKSNVGRIRLRRTGDELTYLAADGPDGNYVQFHRQKAPTEAVKLLKYSGTTGFVGSPLDARLLDLSIRATRIGAPGAAGAGGDSAASSSGGSVLWWLLIPLVLLAAGGLAAWRLLPRRGSAIAAGERPADVALEAQCPNCRKRVTVEAKDVGKRTRCPSCGAPFVAAFPG